MSSPGRLTPAQEKSSGHPLLWRTPAQRRRCRVCRCPAERRWYIEVLPQGFQWIYPFLPFQFGMKAFKECIAGMYGVDYWINVGKMVLFLIIALLLGLALEPPFRKLNHRIEKSKEKTGLMI